jgi:hypothetical protein
MLMHAGNKQQLRELTPQIATEIICLSMFQDCCQYELS